MKFFKYAKKIIPATKAFCHAMSSGEQKQEAPSPTPVEATRIPSNDQAEPQPSAFDVLGAMMPQPSQKESTVEYITKQNGEKVPLKSTQKHVTSAIDGSIEISNQVEHVFRADDGMLVRDASELFECPACHAMVTMPSTYACHLCQRRFCRNSSCRHSVLVDGQDVVICTECAESHVPGNPLKYFVRSIFKF